MTATSPTSMGGPLSEADRLADVREALADWMDNDDCDALLSCDTALLTLLDELEAARARVGVLEGQLATARQQQLCTVVGAYVAWDIDNAKRNDLPITHSIADKSEGKLRGAMATFQELLVALGEIEGDEDLEEVWELVEAEMQSAGSALGLDGGGSDE